MQLSSDNVFSIDDQNQDLAKTWLARIKNSSRYYDSWSSRFDCDRMEEYYYANQWENSNSSYKPYVINMIYATLEVKQPSLVFENPVYHINAKPQTYEYDVEEAVKKSNLRSDVLNSIVSDMDDDFVDEVDMAIRDAFFRFGIIEVGYDANWIVNPNADKPILKSDNTPYFDEEDNVIREPKKLPQNERVYVKRIDPKHFRIGGLDQHKLSRCSWCGYWDYYRIEDVKANATLENLDKIEWTGGRSADFVESESSYSDYLVKTGDLIKLWKVWDLRSKEFYIFSESNGLTLLKKKFKRLPIFDLAFTKAFRGWYPVPPVFMWKWAQDELNDIGEQRRNHRKRFVRKFVYDQSAFASEEEIDKLMNGGDGVFAAALNGDKAMKAVAPVQNADLGAQAVQSLVIEKDTFNIVSGTSDEQRGQGDNITATQSNYINQRMMVRESASRIKVANWLCRIGREILLVAEEKFTQPFWIRMPLQKSTQIGVAQEGPMDNTKEIWAQISSGDLDDKFDYEVNIFIDSMSPIANDEDKQKFLMFLSVMNQFPQISIDPVLVREAAYRVGYRNEEVIQRMQKAIQVQLAQQLAQQMPQGGASGQPPGQNSMAQAQVAQQTPNTMEQIRNQIANQGVQQQ